MTKENLKRLYKHYCEMVKTGMFNGKALTTKAYSNMVKAKADVEKRRPKFVEEYNLSLLPKPKKEVSNAKKSA